MAKQKSIEQITAEIPWRIAAYLGRHYDRSLLKDIKKVKRNGQTFYQLNIEKENNIYRIKFNTDGYLMQKVMEPLFDTGIADELGVGD